MMNISFKRRKLRSVFTQLVATESYVPRLSLEQSFECEMDKTGRPIIVFGKSGNGKSTLINHVLNDHGLQKKVVTISCNEGMTLDSLVRHSLSLLKVSYVDSRSSGESAELGNEFSGGKSHLGVGITAKRGTSYSQTTRMVSTPASNIQNLFSHISASHRILLVEDIHKINEEDRQLLINSLKVYMNAPEQYQTGKVICIGASDYVDKLFSLSREIINRVASIYVPRMEETELNSIVDLGFTALNIKVSDELKNAIIGYSCGQATNVHQLCYDLCYASNIQKTAIFTRNIKDKEFGKVVNQYISSNQYVFKGILEQYEKQSLSWEILKAIAQNGYKIKHDVLIDRVKNNRVDRDEDIIKDAINSLESDSGIISYDIHTSSYYYTIAFGPQLVKLLQQSKKTYTKKEVKPDGIKDINELSSIVELGLLRYIQAYGYTNQQED